MATLEKLLNIAGVVAAGEFTADGGVIDFKAKTETSAEMTAMTARFCATVSMMFSSLASAYTEMSTMKWVPQQVWMYSGGDWTVMMGGRRCVFIETAKADFNHLHQIMAAESVSRPKGAAHME
ncbi:MAG: DUF2173 family protein [Methanofollis sp.]|nr:DUF2173 family protein [Methanofollis sp.]